MSTVIVEVRALTQRGTDFRYGSYLRAGHVFEPGWNEYVVNESELPVLQADPWLELRTLDPRMQASKKMDAALAAKAALDAEEAALKAKREKVNALMADAEASMKAIGNEPPPAKPSEPTPYQDSLMSAMPKTERDKLPAADKSPQKKK